MHAELIPVLCLKEVRAEDKSRPHTIGAKEMAVEGGRKEGDDAFVSGTGLLSALNWAFCDSVLGV